MKKFKTRFNAKIFTGIVLAASLALVATIPAFAQTGMFPANWQDRAGYGQAGQGRGPGVGEMKPGIIGQVTSVSGMTVTVSGHAFDPGIGMGLGGGAQASTTYTIDASNASVTKNNATSSVSAIVVGDTVFASGTVSGTNVIATSIRDGLTLRGRFDGKGVLGMMYGLGPNGQNGQPNRIIKGNGQPVVAGTVSALNGTSLAITTSSNVSYTVDGSNAVVDKGNATSSVSAISVGDYVIVQGTVNGTSVVASSIIDQKAPANSSSDGAPGAGRGWGFFNSIGNFFRHLFGF